MKPTKGQLLAVEAVSKTMEASKGSSSSSWEGGGGEPWQGRKGEHAVPHPTLALLGLVSRALSKEAAAGVAPSSIYRGFCFNFPFLARNDGQPERDHRHQSPAMRVSSRLLQSCRITLFTRENCGLCTQARSVLSDVWDKRPFAFKEVDIIKPESKAWRDLYEFDVPVVSVCIQHLPPPLPTSPTDTTQETQPRPDPHQQGPVARRRPKAVFPGGQTDAPPHRRRGHGKDGLGREVTEPPWISANYTL